MGFDISYYCKLMIQFSEKGLIIEGEFRKESLLEYLNLMESERKRHQDTVDELTRRIGLLKERLFNNSLQQGLSDAAHGKVSKIDLDTL